MLPCGGQIRGEVATVCRPRPSDLPRVSGSVQAYHKMPLAPIGAIPCFHAHGPNMDSKVFFTTRARAAAMEAELGVGMGFVVAFMNLWMSAAHFHWLLVSIIGMSRGPEILLMRLLLLVAVHTQEEMV